MAASKFPPNSRYATVETTELTLPDGRRVSHLRRRSIPHPERFATIGYHLVAQGERPDTLAYETVGDPEQFWRLCDANAVLHPDELTEAVGAEVRLTLPEGIAGPTDA